MPALATVKVLIVEDQRRLGQFLRKGMSEQAYTATWVQSCREARDALCETSYDVIILDLSLPDGDGLALLREWRKGGFNEPIIILSARDAVQDRINGLDAGADDYLPKPFSLEELVARVRSLMRRQSSTKETALEHAGLRMDLLARLVTQHGRTVELTSREFALLELAEERKYNPGQARDAGLGWRSRGRLGCSSWPLSGRGMDRSDGRSSNGMHGMRWACNKSCTKNDSCRW